MARTYSYSGEALCDQRMAVFRRAIDAAAAVDGQGFAAIKVTALGLPSLLERVSLALVAIQDLFRRFDAGGSGRLGRPEFRQAYRALFSDDGDSRMEEVRMECGEERSGAERCITPSLGGPLPKQGPWYHEQSPGIMRTALLPSHHHCPLPTTP